MIDIHLTAQEAHALYNVTAGIMRRGAGTPELGSVARKLRGKVAAIVCCDCGSRVVYSQGRCQRCYRYGKRTGARRPSDLEPHSNGAARHTKGGCSRKSPPL